MLTCTCLQNGNIKVPVVFEQDLKGSFGPNLRLRRRSGVLETHELEQTISITCTRHLLGAFPYLSRPDLSRSVPVPAQTSPRIYRTMLAIRTCPEPYLSRSVPVLVCTCP